MKNEGGWGAGKFSKMVSVRGDRCLFTFNVAVVFSSKYFRFLFVKPK
jgi:hypothetical protein